MYDLNNIKIHNNYHYQLIDKNGNIIEEHTVYNESRPGLYVAQVGQGSLNSVPLTVFYKRKKRDNEGNIVTEDYESSITAGVSIYRTSSASNISYGYTIEYKGSTDFLASSFVGTITRFCLGGGYTPRTEGGWGGSESEPPPTYYWSEASGGGDKGETVSLHIDITIFMSASRPSFPVRYDQNISSILHINDPSTLSPGPKWVGLSSINISDLPDREMLNKRIPIAFQLPMAKESLPDEGAYRVYSPTTSVERDGVTILNSGEGNYGSLFSMVFGEIGATSIGGYCSDIYIPAVVLTPQKIQNLLDKDLEEYVFFCSVPPGCSYQGISVNGTLEGSGGGITWTDPNGISKMTPRAVGMEEGEERTLDSYRNTDVGDYYANCLLGGCWEPPSGTSTCPRFLYFSSAPSNIYVGAYTGATVQVKVNNQWQNVGSARTYTTVYFDYSHFSNIQDYRVVVSAPSENSRFYVNEAEGLTVPNKSFDPNVLCIGDSGDFGTAGITISRSRMQALSDGIFQEQRHSGYNIGIRVNANCFYKCSNTIGYLQYEVKASG